MLFNSYVFLFVFLPIVVAGFFALGHFGRRRLAVGWLVLASLAFYGYWNVAYVPLLAASVLFNYGIGYALSRVPDERRKRRRAILIVGVAANLGLLGVFKYTDFILGTAGTLSGHVFELRHIILPLAISFFTFNQIAYLADVYRRLAEEYDVLNYAFFVTFFPHLIAGPIVHHRDIIPQLKTIAYRFTTRDMSVGFTLFAIGLFEKVGLADPLAPLVNAVFGSQAPVAAVWAWTGTVAYALQLYFDFAGYSTMAIGLAWMFGIRFPTNFNSPYRAASIVDFWRRWHMTLSRFLRDYLYIPLGGNRYGHVRRYLALFATMLLGGLWHGAAWTFVLWGGLHGVYLAINHAWEALGRRFDGLQRVQAHPATRAAGYAITLVAVLVGWVFFRSANVPTALHLLTAMTGLQGALPHVQTGLPGLLYTPPTTTMMLRLMLLFALATVFPNAMELFSPGKRDLSRLIVPLRWKPDTRWALAVGAVAAAGVLLSAESSTFLYYQF